MNSIGIFARIDQLGHFVTSNIEYTFRIFMMVYLSLRATFRDQAQGWRTIFGVISAQIYFTGFQAMPLISFLALAAGGVTILQSSANLSILGGTNILGNILVAIVVRELGPLLTALVVIARSGTAVASEVGNMRANREIEALESMGINPLSFIVFPRLIGGVISVMVLSFYFNIVALGGGFLLTKLMHDMSAYYYTDLLLNALGPEDIWIFLLKSSFSGFVIFIVSCYHGMSVKRSPTEVPIVTTQAVMNSIIYVTVFNVSVSIIYYLSQLSKLGIVI